MILRRLHVQRFRGLADFRAEFTPGLNVVFGPNEAGKSTLQEAIAAALFQKASLTEGQVSGLLSWQTTDAPELVAEFTIGDDAYTLQKDFREGHPLLTLPDGSRLKSDRTVQERMAALTGVTDSAVYGATACLRQQQWAHLPAGGVLQEVLQRNLSGAAAGADVEGIIRDLDRAITELNRGTVRVAQTNPGPIAQVRGQIEAAEADLRTARDESESAGQARLTLEQTQEALQGLDAELRQARALQARVDQFEKLRARGNEIRQEADRLRSRLDAVAKLTGEIDAIRDGLQQAAQVDQQLAADVASWLARKAEREDELNRDREQLRRTEDARKRFEHELASVPSDGPTAGDVEEARRLRTAIEEQRTRVAELAEDAVEASQAMERAQRAATPRRTLLAAGILLVVIGGALAQWWTPGWGLAAVGIIVAVLGARYRVPEGARDLPARMAEIEAQSAAARREAEEITAALGAVLARTGAADMDALAGMVETSERQRFELQSRVSNERGNIATLTERIGEREAIVRALEDKLTEALRSTGLASVGQLQEEAVARDKAMRTLREKEAALKAHLQGDTAEAIDEAYKAASLEFVGLKAKMEEPEMLGADLSPERYQELLDRIAELAGQQAGLEQTARDAQRQIDIARHDPDDVAALEGRLVGLRDREALLCERLEVWTLAREVIAEARSRRLGEVTELIAPQVGETLALLTGRRYCKVGLDSDMRPSVVSPEAEREIVVGVAQEPGLSCATREQVFLAARLALVDMLWPEDGPPVLMDDPLVNFDVDRKQAAVEVIRAASRKRQVIVFTCGEDFLPAADNVVRMPGPAVS